MVYTRKINSAKRKQSGDIRLFMPLILDSDIATSESFDVSSNLLINGACLYGDDAKREGLADATAYSQANKKVTRILDVHASIGGLTHGSARPSCDDIMSGEYGLLRVERHSTKADLSEEIDIAIKKRAEELYPRLKDRDIDNWLQLDPSLAHVLFDIYPVNIIIVNTGLPYSKKILSVAIIKESYFKENVTASLMHFSKVKINFTDSR